MRIGKTFGIGSLLITAAVATTPVQAEPRSVVASILPVHSLVAGLLDGIHQADVLLPASGSPHGYAMRPSEARLLHNADLLIWVGPDLETFLERSVSEPQAGRVVISLMNDLSLELLATRKGGVWEEQLHDHGHDQAHGDHGHGDEDSHDHGHDHDHGDHRHGADHGNGHDDGNGNKDAHIWLSPDNARNIATGLTEYLVRWDPANAAAFERNRATLLARIDALDVQLGQQLAPVRDRPFIVFHDAYQYFERYYGLNAAGSITIDPARSPGARRIQELRNRLDQDDVACLFTEPQFRPALAQTLVEGHDTRLGELDPVGSELQPGPDAWFQLMQNMADSLTSCLAPGAS
ncbi:MAG: zinc ABC transporter substrate-binding protein ZnuA [Thioalkalivibrio sp.]|nr:zinc ABC transporter substrate-binding protein ZnuA [Thioalkalivibrio sp.]